MRQRTGIVASTSGNGVPVTDPGQTEEEPGSEQPHSARNLQAVQVPPHSRTSEQRWVKCPATNQKERLQLYEDIDKILEATSKGDVDHKLQTVCTLIMSIGVERFGVTEKPVTSNPVRPNRQELTISQLRQELKSLKRQFNVAKEEERTALTERREILR